MWKKILLLALMIPVTAMAEGVNLDNLVRAESDTMMRANLKSFGIEIGQITHVREPTTPERQPVIRMNQDTLYSGIVLDLSKPVKIMLPEVGGRYMSMHVVNQDHYMFFETKPGTYELTKDLVGTRFALVTVRTFANPRDPEDMKKAHVAQDAIKVEGGGSGPFEAPDWDLETLAKARNAFNEIAATLGFDSARAFGRPEEVRPIDYVVGALSGWGGLPQSAAMYVITSVAKNDGGTQHAVTVRDVPVDAFWSVTVYNADGYLEANDLGVNSYNNITAQANQDGAYTIHFGGCDDGRINCIPITPGWNYAVRLYGPQPEILDGSWVFPSPKPVQ
jgi:hypothetical protein